MKQAVMLISLQHPGNPDSGRAPVAAPATHQINEYNRVSQTSNQNSVAIGMDARQRFVAALHEPELPRVRSARVSGREAGGLLMSFFGARRSRQPRVFRPSSSSADQLFRKLRDYRSFSLVLVGVLAVVGLQLATQLGAPQLSLRQGDYVSRGVLARVNFEVINEGQSRRLREQAGRQAPLVLKQQEFSLDLLTAELRNDLQEVANSGEMAEVSEATVSGFGLASDTEAEEIDDTSFVVLRNHLSSPDESSGDRIETMIEDFVLLTEDLARLGLCDLSELRYQPGDSDAAELTSDSPIQVIDADGEIVHEGVMADVLIADQLLDTGRLGAKWLGVPVLAVVKDQINAWLAQHIQGQLQVDARSTLAARQERMDATAPAYTTYEEMSPLVPPGSRLTPQDLEVLREESRKYESELSFAHKLPRQAGWFICLIAAVILAGKVLQYSAPDLLFDGSKLLVYVLMCSSVVFVACLASDDPLRAEIIPLLAAVMVATIVHGQAVALLTALTLPTLVSVATVASTGHLLTLLLVCILSLLPLRKINSRLVMIRAGFILAVGAMVIHLAVSWVQFEGQHSLADLRLLLFSSSLFAGYALFACFFVAGSLPLIEQAFGIVTDISLLELSGVSHPLLQELARRAPGTYNHSITVASMAEAAADAIGANGLLTRVGAYFHDIGKMMKPEYFIENMLESEKSPHHALAPAMSTLIIIGHVKDGLELADENDLPVALHPFIAEHHGTTLVEYFFQEAARKADTDHRTDASESSFRYPGPRPQTKETAVLMLADAVESASRTLKEPTPKRIQSLVSEITMKRLLDGQFDQCNLQMNEIRLIEDSLIKSLLAAHHGRVRYPGQRTA